MSTREKNAALWAAGLAILLSSLGCSSASETTQGASDAGGDTSATQPDGSPSTIDGSSTNDGAPNANDGAPNDGAADVVTGDACAPAVPCSQVANSCLVGTTECDGTCAAVNDAPDGTACATGVCLAGVCTPCAVGAACEPASAPCHVGALACGDAGPVCVDQGTNLTAGTACGAQGANTFCSPTGSCTCTSGASCAFSTNPCHQGVTSCTTSGSEGVSVCTDSGNAVANGIRCGTGQACDQGTCTAITCSTTNTDGGAATCAPANACDQGVVACGADGGEFGAASCTDTGPLPAGAPCTGGVCNGSGTCTPCVNGGSCPLVNPCDTGSQVCAAVISCTDTGHQPPGTPCGGTTDFCDGAGQCNCIAGGACTPTNTCHNGIFSCSTGVQVCVDQDTNVTGNPSCGGGNLCNAGTCQAPTCSATTADGGVATCPPTNSCHNGEVACPGGPFGASSCTDLGTNLANCTSCAAGSVCSAGACTPFTANGACPLASNACEKGEATCSVATGIACIDSGTHQPPGATCSSGVDNACDGNGNCSCAAGGTCTIPGSCQSATFSCATGTAVCTAGTTNLSNGASCGTNHVCFGGACDACTEGAFCTATGNACLTGAIVCTSGQPVCSDNVDAPAGTTCSSGVDNACDGKGDCNCAAGGPCTPSPDPCANGVFSCATGTAACAAGSEIVSMNGQSCGGTGTCTSGACACPGGQEYFEGACNPCTTFPGTTVYVDVTSGTDDVCCGRSTTAGFGGPCLTITHALKQVGGSSWTVNFTGDLNGNMSAGETYPISLSGGAILVAGAAACLPGVSGQPVIEAVTDSTPVFVGNGQFPFTIGASCEGVASGASSGIYVDAGSVSIPGGTTGGPIIVGTQQGVSINGAGFVTTSGVYIEQASQDGVYVGPGSGVCGYGFQISNARYGINFDGGQICTGPGNYFSSNRITGSSQDAIHCASVTNPALISGGGVAAAYYGGVEAAILSAGRYGVYAGPGCNLIVDDGTIGPASCATSRPDNVGIYVEGNGSVGVEGEKISCMNGDAIVLANNTLLSGSPTVSIGNSDPGATTDIHNNGCAGVRALAGTFAMNNTTVTNNHWGVIQQTAATGTTGIVNIDGTSGASAAPNAIYCNGNTEAGLCNGEGNGANVWNDSALPLTATNDSWDATIVAKCTCNSALASCACTGAPFGDTTPPDDLDVLVSPFTSGGATGAVTTTGNLAVTSPTCSYDVEVPCTQGALRCANGQQPQTCNGSSAWQNTGSPCPSDQLCSAAPGGPACVCNNAPTCSKDGPVCTSAGDLETCGTDGNGCLVVTTPPGPCVAHEACSGAAGAAKCACSNDPTCPTTGPTCSGIQIETCAVDTNTCLFVSTPAAACPTNAACTGAAGSATCACDPGYVLSSGNCVLPWPNGSLGALVVATGTTVTLTSGSVYDYSSVDVEAGGTLQIGSGSGWTFIGVSGAMVVSGNIVVQGDGNYLTSPVTVTAQAPDATGALLGETVSYTLGVQGAGGTGGTCGGGVTNRQPGDGGFGNGGGGCGFGYGMGAWGDDQCSGCTIGGNGTLASGGNGGEGTCYQTIAGASDYATAGGNAPACTGSCTAGAAFGGGGGGGGSRGQNGQGLYLKVAGDLTGNGDIIASGQTGGQGGNASTVYEICNSAYYFGGGGGGGGGAGGSGGAVAIRYHAAISSALVTNIQTQGGPGGPGGTAGAGGVAGTVGVGGGNGANGPAPDVQTY